MKVKLSIGNKSYETDLNEPLDISIPFILDKSPIAFGANPYDRRPFEAGSFIGALEAGSPVNFYDIKINPHGNGTHTESALHIDKRGKSINDTLKDQHFVARLITVRPSELESGDKIVDQESLDFKVLDLDDVNALIIRTRPNTIKKKSQNYTGKNPVYFCHKLTKQISNSNVDHLLIDVPSVDREVDGGKLKAHNAFWNTKGNLKAKKTITEMIFVDNKIKDGLYLLNLQTIPLDIDASPSRPVLYRLK